MNLAQRLAISYYKEIAVINKEHQIYLVQHIETKKLFVKKILSVYNLDIYNYLLDHPISGTPAIHAVCEEDDKLTVIEDYLSGDTLAEILDKHGPMDIRTACSYVYSVCEIVARLHSCNPPIIHRDIKPSNILLGPGNQIYLLDFNAAKYYSEDQNTDTVLLGTHGFAAPEQYGFGASSVQTDVYSLGMLLKTLVDGSPIEFDPYADTFFTIAETCTRLNPWERYASVEELRRMLLQILDRPSIDPYYNATISKRAFSESNIYDDSFESDDSSETSYPWFLLPGFRSLHPAYMLLAGSWYALFTYVCLTLDVVDASLMDLIVERIICFFMLFGSTLFLGNYLNIQKFFPFCRHKKRWIRIPAVITFTLIYCFFCLVLAAISSLIFN